VLMTAPVLAMLMNKDPYQLKANALAHTVGTTLLQRQNGIWRPITFMSKVLSLTQQNYKIYDRELLAIMIALEDF
jgi:ABC-type transport system involved in cytochrome c biogenesis permease component